MAGKPLGLRLRYSLEDEPQVLVGLFHPGPEHQLRGFGQLSRRRESHRGEIYKGIDNSSDFTRRGRRCAQQRFVVRLLDASCVGLA